eukprot:3744560-Alexandrium_andersonii.AAC.1
MLERPLVGPKVRLQNIRGSPSKLRGVSSFRTLQDEAGNQRLLRRHLACASRFSREVACAPESARPQSCRDPELPRSRSIGAPPRS